jgi:UPF0755 protein
MLVIGAVICGGVVFVLSGGRVGDFVQTQLARIRLTSQEAALNQPMGTDETPVRFSIATGESPRSIAQNLLNAGLIADADLFVDYVRAYDLDVQLEAGIFFLYQTESIAEIARALTDSASSQFAFRILEGQRIEEVAFMLVENNRFFGFSGAEFYAAVGPGAQPVSDFARNVGLPAGASLEGFLFPDTYQLPAAVTPEMLRDILLQQFTERLDPDITQGAAQQGLSLFQIVTLASIIQREAVRTDEMPLIASVYRNRLNIGMKLDADPTVQYAIGLRGESWWPQIAVADYQAVQSPYNTYLQAGLPPGPIANPGEAAIRAAVFPQQSDYFYFRARCDGSGYHNFARTFEEHLNNACP